MDILKNVVSENRVEQIRLIDPEHYVVGGQPVGDWDTPNDNNAHYDLACTMQYALDKIEDMDDDVRRMIFGVIYPTMLPTAPNGALFLDGDSFDVVKYPRLAALYPTGVLPDLQERYLIGAGPKMPVRSLIAQAVLQHTHTASSGNAGSHAHTASAANAGSHGHTTSCSASGDHAHSAWTDTQSHNHSQGHGWTGTGFYAGGPFGLQGIAGGDAETSWHAHAHGIGVGAGGNHAHTIGIGVDGNHAHAITVNAAGDHSHTVTVAQTGSAKQLVDAIAINYMIKAE